ncbi:Aste57867_4664 [Aphanomyces stellatus]|uniref:Aste57867_4664 protein n=1 Tax=Aphanomyces stellatus TaxID=120398 RepID=A0A485KE94_9STRA|nr:hypothetical protein As57867_004651 [Aphanomyces stellatus]VFT81767.1 Aste57867_4664 [Aphanomyces stellatus]
MYSRWHKGGCTLTFNPQVQYHTDVNEFDSVQSHAIHAHILQSEVAKEMDFDPPRGELNPPTYFHAPLGIVSFTILPANAKMKTATFLVATLAITTATMFKGLRLRDAMQEQCSGGVSEYYDYPGNDIGNVPASRYDECCTACANDSRCVLVVWNPKDQKCYKKDKMSSPVYLVGVETYFMSGRGASYQPDQPKKQCGNYEYDADYTGNDLSNVYAYSTDDCCSQCSRNPRCKVAVFNSNQNTCYLKDGKGGRSNLPGAVTINMS